MGISQSEKWKREARTTQASMRPSRRHELVCRRCQETPSVAIFIIDSRRHHTCPGHHPSQCLHSRSSSGSSGSSAAAPEDERQRSIAEKHSAAVITVMAICHNSVRQPWLQWQLRDMTGVVGQIYSHGHGRIRSLWRRLFCIRHGLNPRALNLVPKSSTVKHGHTPEKNQRRFVSLACPNSV